MKRIYLALVFIIFGVIAGIVEYNTVNKSIDNCILSINRIGEYVRSEKIEKAESLSKKTAAEFERYSKKILFCYYKHDKLEEITELLYSLEDLLDDKRVEDYHEMSHSIRQKLLSLKGKEPVTIQNIL